VFSDTGCAGDEVLCSWEVGLVVANKELESASHSSCNKGHSN